MINRYSFEAERHFGVLDSRLEQRRHMVGDTYTIVDMAVWGWARILPFILGDEAWGSFPHLKRYLDEISARPAAIRAGAYKDKYAFKAVWDDEARRYMFPQNARLAG